MRNYLNFIGGEWLSAQSGGTCRTLNPADTRETVAQYPLSGQSDAAAAIAAAQQAFPGWAARTSVARGRVLSKASQVLESRKAELAELLTREEGKTLPESAGEVQRAIDIFRFFGYRETVFGPNVGVKFLECLAQTAKHARWNISERQPAAFPNKSLHVGLAITAVVQRLDVLRTEQQQRLPFPVGVTVADIRNR